ncbi:LLM class flavin-dependent oxidoreductase [Nocardioides conyzicola]|uniref:LLM class flavin-dependent oxidoreductase n=1 Tax=Nocardioides conyzicola TaxID=1651781 RepID=A0ABP8XVI3_9ACTN
MTRTGPHLSVAIDGAGWHPAAWREADADPAGLFRAASWTQVVQEAEAGLLDLVTFEDSLALQSSRWDGPDDRVDRVRGRLDAVLLASRLAPVTRHIGLVPSVVATHTEPFHVSKAIATLDFVSHGRAGVRVRVSARADEARLVGRRELPTRERLGELLDEAADHVEVQRRLWDSWEDGAEIRDVESGRFIDRDRLHYIDFEGAHFSVRGPSITPRPPQGQPPVLALAHTPAVVAYAARSSDVVIVTPQTDDEVGELLAGVRYAEASVDRAGPPLLVWGDLLVVLGATEALARERLERLDARAGEPLQSDARVFCGTPERLADLVEDWHARGLDGLRLRPAAVPADLTAITRGLVPKLQRRGSFRTAYDAGSLRSRLGLERPVNRYEVTA